MFPVSSRTIAAGAVVAATALAVPLGGCPREDAGDACSDYEPPASFDAQDPAVSFAKDVMPIFAQRCAFASCHGSTAGGANGIYLGGTDATKVHDGIVDVASSELPTMTYAKAGDPRASFLMRKLDGSQCVLNEQCTASDCGLAMPKNDAPLSLAARDTIRRWIAQGAKND